MFLIAKHVLKHVFKVLQWRDGVRHLASLSLGAFVELKKVLSSANFVTSPSMIGRWKKRSRRTSEMNTMCVS